MKITKRQIRSIIREAIDDLISSQTVDLATPDMPEPWGSREYISPHDTKPKELSDSGGDLHLVLSGHGLVGRQIDMYVRMVEDGIFSPGPVDDEVKMFKQAYSEAGRYSSRATDQEVLWRLEALGFPIKQDTDADNDGRSDSEELRDIAKNLEEEKTTAAFPSTMSVDVPDDEVAQDFLVLVQLDGDVFPSVASNA
mgnify:CR=1 FL=1